MQFSAMRTNPNTIVTTIERQPVPKMLQSRSKRQAQLAAIHHMQDLSPFVSSYRTVANERHPTRNEDSILIDETTGLFAVFDGVGGSAAAEIASQTAKQAVTQTWRGMLRRCQRRRKGNTLLEDCEHYDVSSMLEQVVLEADDQVRIDGALRAGTDDLATTVALVALCKQPKTDHYTMISAHVGDSRIYLLRGQESLKRLTNDDGFLTKLIENQIIDEQHASLIDQAMQANQLTDIEYRYFRLRGGITQALGGPTVPIVHINKTTIKPADRILLCTDGIHDNLTDNEIETIIRKTPRTSAARVLVEHSRERSHMDYTDTIRAKPDDMSAIVLTCRF